MQKTTGYMPHSGRTFRLYYFEVLMAATEGRCEINPSENPRTETGMDKPGISMKDVNDAFTGYSHLAGGRRRKCLVRNRQTSHGKEGRAQFVLVDISPAENPFKFSSSKYSVSAQLAYPSDTSF
jgi:hypothetical protein